MHPFKINNFFFFLLPRLLLALSFLIQISLENENEKSFLFRSTKQDSPLVEANKDIHPIPRLNVSIHLQWLQLDATCDPSAYKTYMRQHVLDYIQIPKKNLSNLFCDVRESLECDKTSKKCDCMALVIDYEIRKNGPYYLRKGRSPEDQNDTCLATNGSRCDQRFQCGPGLECQRLRCECIDEKNCSFLSKPLDSSWSVTSGAVQANSQIPRLFEALISYSTFLYFYFIILLLILQTQPDLISILIETDEYYY